jgi:RNase P subunit RPR2
VTAGIVVGTIAIVLVVVVIGVLIDRKVRVVPKPEDFKATERRKPATAHAAGEAPATAIRARASQLAKLRMQRCTHCRAELTNGPDDTVTFDERELLVLTFSCGACGAKRSLYVERS